MKLLEQILIWPLNVFHYGLQVIAKLSTPFSACQSNLHGLISVLNSVKFLTFIAFFFYSLHTKYFSLKFDFPHFHFLDLSKFRERFY